MNNIVSILVLIIATIFSPTIMAGSLTICGSNSIQYSGIPIYIAKEMIIETTINDRYQPQKNIELNTNSCTDYEFNGDKANVKIREKFSGTDYYFNWIDIPLIETTDKMTIYVCQGLHVAGIADPVIAGVIYADHFGKSTFSKSEWDLYNYKCGQEKPNQHWSGLLWG